MFLFNIRYIHKYKVTKMGSIIGHRIDYNGPGRGSERPAVHTEQNFTQVAPPGACCTLNLLGKA